MEFNFYIVRNGEILYKCGTEEEVEEIISQDETGELEYYPKEARTHELDKCVGLK